MQKVCTSGKWLYIRFIKQTKPDQMSLINTLKKETESLRIQYLEMTEAWSRKEFQILRQFADDYCAGKLGYGEASKQYHRLPWYIVNSNGKVEQHTEKMLKNAVAHYEASIEKLAFRIESKGLDINNMTIQYSHIGVNIEMIMTDGNKSVKAQTIIASGEVQRPHYRYLIK